MKKVFATIAGKDFSHPWRGIQRKRAEICFSSSPEQEIKFRKSLHGLAPALFGTPAFISEATLWWVGEVVFRNYRILSGSLYVFIGIGFHAGSHRAGDGDASDKITLRTRWAGFIDRIHQRHVVLVQLIGIE